MIKHSLKNIIFLIVIGIGILNVDAVTNPYSKTGPYGINCTWYAWKIVKEKSDITLPSWGDAKDWYSNAKNAGYSVGTFPKVNSIVVWGDWTAYGHVGYVEAVEGNTIRVWDSTGPCIDEEDSEYQECMANGVSEESDKACKANAKRIACKYNISPSDYTITGYIYLNDAPITISTTKKKETTKITTVKKSNNAYLNDIILSEGVINFDKEVFKYSIEVENDVDLITIDAKAEDKKATIKGNGDYELNIGVNEIKLIVTAEDDSKKEYIIKVSRNKKVEVDNAQTENYVKKNIKQKNILLISCILIILIFVLLIFIKKRKNLKKEN